MANYSSTNTTSNTVSKTYASGQVNPNTQLNLEKYQKDYQESQKVQNAYNMLQNTLNNKPQEFQSSYTDQLNQMYNNIMNRQDFSYNMNADALYQQYKDQYQMAGKQAMKDTVAQASALTGGYANSYAQTAGQQTYQNYLAALNDKVPELYDRAYQKYKDEGDRMNNQFNLTKDMYNTEYGEYRDKVSDYQADRDYFLNQYNNERNFDYNQFSDNRKYWTDEYWNEKNSAHTTESTTTSNSLTKTWSDDPEVEERITYDDDVIKQYKESNSGTNQWNNDRTNQSMNSSFAYNHIYAMDNMTEKQQYDYLMDLMQEGEISHGDYEWFTKVMKSRTGTQSQPLTSFKNDTIKGVL